MQGEASRGVWGVGGQSEKRRVCPVTRSPAKVFAFSAVLGGFGGPVHSHLWRRHDYISPYILLTLNYGDHCFELLYENAVISLIPLLGTTCVNMSYIAIADLKKPTALTPV